MSQEVQKLLATTSPELRALALRVRKVVRSIAPDAIEKVYPGWCVIGYSHDGSMKGSFCGIGPAKEYVGVYIHRGGDLDDPAGILEGAGRTMRHVKVRTAKDADQHALRALIAASAKLTRAEVALAGARVGAKTRAKSAVRDDASAAGMSSAAVEAKTGKSWAKWFAALDAAGARGRTHQEIVAILVKKHKVGLWWQQMITVAYEQERGGRKKHEKAGGFEIGASKTIAAPIAALERAWIDAAMRARWLSNPAFTVRKATPKKSMRITWIDGETNLDVMFYAKGAAKSAVHVQHGKLASAAAAEKMKKYWKAQLEKLKATLETKDAPATVRKRASLNAAR